MRRLLLIGLCLLIPRFASADTIHITSGTMTATGGPYGNAWFVLNGDDFSFAGGGSLLNNFYAPAELPCAIACGAPQSISLGGTFTGGSGDFAGYVTFAGTRLRVGTIADTAYVTVYLAGVLAVPAASGLPTATASAPFTMTGIFNDGQMHSFGLIGGGVASIGFTAAHPSFQRPWRYESAVYTFAAPEITEVPEPATVLLLGGPALIGLWRRHLIECAR